MAYWLLKSEPAKYSWAQMVKDRRTHWDGVHNYQAALNMKAMKRGDRAFFYHSNEGKEIVGIAKVVKEAYKDPTSDDDWSVVELAPVKKLAHPVTLAAIKAHKTLRNMALVKRGRISVVPVTEKEAALVVEISGRAPS